MFRGETGEVSGATSSSAKAREQTQRRENKITCPPIYYLLYCPPIYAIYGFGQWRNPWMEQIP